MTTIMENKEILRLSNEDSNKLTRECLCTAMFKLMAKQEFERISITEITKLAGVSRAAFYRNYESKEALVEEMCHEILQRLSESVKSERYRTNRREWYANFFQTIQENKEYFRIYLNAKLPIVDHGVLESIFPSASSRERYDNMAREGAFLGILTSWFEAGMQETPQEMSEICERIFVHRGGQAQ